MIAASMWVEAYAVQLIAACLGFVLFMLCRDWVVWQWRTAADRRAFRREIADVDRQERFAAAFKETQR